jgi:hypothetical protein
MKKVEKDQLQQPVKESLKDIEDMYIVKTGCPFFYGYQDQQDLKYTGRQDKTNEHQSNLKTNPISDKIQWDVPLSVSEYRKIG